MSKSQELEKIYQEVITYACCFWLEDLQEEDRIKCFTGIAKPMIKALKRHAKLAGFTGSKEELTENVCSDVAYAIVQLYYTC